MNKLELINVKTELNMHEYLKSKGFETNYKKHENDNGFDVIAIKDGIAFLIEHKKLQLRENGVYRYNDEIKGDILILSTPNGKSFVALTDKTSLTKTARFLEML